MADTEEPPFKSLADRIAALNRQKNGPGHQLPRQRPPPPPPPVLPVRPPGQDQAEIKPDVALADAPTPVAKPTVSPGPNRGLPPPLPRRNTDTPVVSVAAAVRSSPLSPPPLPSRTPSSQPSLASTSHLSPPSPGRPLAGRRGSASSELSQASTASSLSLSQVASSNPRRGSNGLITQRKLPPPTSDPASLPPLPPSRRQLNDSARGAASMKASSVKHATKLPLDSPSLPTASHVSPHSKPTLPPRLPARPSKSPKPPADGLTEAAKHELKAKPAQKQNFPLAIRGFGSGQASSRPLGSNVETRVDGDAPPPPPVPLASRPSLAQIEAASARTVAPSPPRADCLVCRDWSGPDTVAAQFPRDTIPSRDPVSYLASSLCAGFPSYADKARAIFTWFHHNIYYDTAAFFSNNVRGMSVEETIFSGKAVCQGYADTYKAIADRAGLDCLVVVGHGKGFGHRPLRKGEAPPRPKAEGHAWNAVRLDDGEWKLVDACWGAGHICQANNLYRKEFAPQQFTSSNERFGLRHFPREGKYQFRADSRILSWEEYFRGPIDGEAATLYKNAHQEGIAEDSVEPGERDIAVGRGRGVVSFRFAKMCEHWRSEVHGPGPEPLLLLCVHGVGGQKDDMIPIQTDGYRHWIDIEAEQLGVAGQTVEVVQLTTIDGHEVRGLSAEEYLSRKGRSSMAWSFVLRWCLV